MLLDEAGLALFCRRQHMRCLLLVVGYVMKPTLCRLRTLAHLLQGPGSSQDVTSRVLCTGEND
jgi:hypothetical protein